MVFKPALALDREEIARDRDAHVLLADAGQFERQNQITLGGVHVHWRRPAPPRGGRGTTKKVVEEAIHFSLNVRHAKRLPTIRSRKAERTPTLHRHRMLLLHSPWPGSLFQLGIEYVVLISSECVHVKYSTRPGSDKQ